MSSHLVVASKAIRVAWHKRPWTFKRACAIVFWWLMACVVLPPFHLMGCALVGALEGMGHGLAKGAADAYADAKKYWAMFEECE